MVAPVLPSTAGIILVEDNAPSVTYSPPAAWAISNNDTLYTGRSYHLTYHVGAKVVFQFTGSEVWFYADNNIDHGRFSVAVDAEASTQYNGLSRVLKMQIELFHRTVAPGAHMLTITNLDDKKALGVDYFVYMPLPGSPGPVAPNTNAASPNATVGGYPSGTHKQPYISDTPSGNNTTPNDSNNNSNNSDNSKAKAVPLAPGIYIGIALGSFALLVFAILGFLMWRDRRSHSRRRHTLFPQASQAQSQSQQAPRSTYSETAQPWLYFAPAPTSPSPNGNRFTLQPLSPPAPMTLSDRSYRSTNPPTEVPVSADGRSHFSELRDPRTYFATSSHSPPSSIAGTQWKDA